MAEHTSTSTSGFRGSLPAAPPLADPARLQIPAAGTDQPEAYKPVALLAILGIGIAIPYAVGLTFACIYAIYAGTPLLLPGITALAPIVAAIVCLAALTRIKRSEGVLGGARLAVWGLRLSLIVGLGYWAYYAATYLAVRRQADEVCRKWLQKIADDKLTFAFLNTIDPKNKPPREEPDGSNEEAILKDLEMRFNQGTQADPRGMLTRFPEHDIVHFLRQGGKNVKMEFLGSSGWEYKDGYTIGLRYRLEGPEGAVIVRATLQGRDGVDDNTKGSRQWWINLGETHLEGGPRFSELGKRKVETSFHAQQFATYWCDELKKGNFDVAYLKTIDNKAKVSEESRVILNGILPMLQVMPATPLTPAAVATLASQTALVARENEFKSLSGYEAFLDGEFVKPRDKTYYATDKKLAETILTEFKKRFRHPDREFVPFIKLEPSQMPLVTEENDKLIFEVDGQFRVVDRKVALDVVLVAVFDNKTPEGEKPNFVLRNIELRRAKEISLMPASHLKKIPLPGMPESLGDKPATPP